MKVLIFLIYLKSLAENKCTSIEVCVALLSKLTQLYTYYVTISLYVNLISILKKQTP